MVRVGRDRLLDQGHADTQFIIADAEKLPIQSGTVDGITMAFGLRNVTDKPAALAAMTKALKPGARLVVLGSLGDLESGPTGVRILSVPLAKNG